MATDTAPFSDLADPIPGTRIFAQRVVPRLADAAPGGRVRLDALAEWLQDTAYADVLDAGLHDAAVWVVRRARLSVRAFPRFGEPATVRTWCSGLGRLWAERRTTVTSPGGADVEAVATWVHLDQRSGRPVPLTERELEVYGASAAGRVVRARLRHPPPPPAAAHGRWRFHAADLDLADHVNNAVVWRPLEERLLARPQEPTAIDAEIEHRAPIRPGELDVRHADGALWLMDGDEPDGIRASIVHVDDARR